MEDKREILNAYIKANVAPMLINFMEAKDLPNAITISATLSLKDLNGHYENTKYCPPKWFKELEENDEKIILVIDKIDTISDAEQTKFIEILKYKKVSTFELSKDYRIILTYKNLNKVSKEIKSLSAVI